MAPLPKPKKVKKKRKSKKLNFPGIIPPNQPQVEFGPEYQRDFERMQETCYEGLHRPNVVKIVGFSGAVYYVCRECLDKYMKDHDELKEVVVAFKR